MSDHTPTTEQIREQIGCTGIDDYEYNYTEYVENPKYLFQAERFDRWLAQYTAEKRAEWEAEQGGVEWEYGNEQLLHSRVEVFAASSEAVARAQAWLYPIRRRRKAGPWVPVNENEGTDRENGSEHDGTA